MIKSMEENVKVHRRIFTEPALKLFQNPCSCALVSGACAANRFLKPEAGMGF